MFSQTEAGIPFRISQEIQYEKNKAVKQVFIDQNGLRVLLVAIDHAELPDHPAPADTLVMVLEGDGYITYNGVQTHLSKNDSFKFDKGVIHSVTADQMKFMLIFA